MTRDSQHFQLKKKRKMIAGVCFFAVIFLITIIKGGALSSPEDIIVSGQEPPVTAAGIETESEKNDLIDSEKAEEVLIVIDVAGAVSRPGILFLPEGSRVYEALEQAGGVLKNSELQDINLASVLLDGEKLYIPSKGEYAEKQGAEQRDGKAVSSKPKKININTANSSELQELPGVGPSIASRILEYRKEHGRFQKISELKNVKGIGDKTFEKWKDSISVI